MRVSRGPKQRKIMWVVMNWQWKGMAHQEFGLGFPIYKEDHGSNSVQLKEKEKAVGSRPPGCINKCLNCRPCMATLVIQPHQWRWNNKFKRFFKTTSHHDEEGGSSYYLLSWKCKCNNKLFKP
ncbi:hypothetical protein Ddye_007004 [Dipteronia dyeriana]|uniref:Epidermal patterning factor-like protein n=1 Tax=Dipteronia dyeriana TaxID=168575 RepID=A0AAD9XJQ1_9ROSI|nr:hypothetical protein Ddye_007004 [Dipteronia dyeriana]